MHIIGPCRDGCVKLMSDVQCVHGMLVANSYADEKQAFVFAKHVPITFQITFHLLINLFSSFYKTNFSSRGILEIFRDFRRAKWHTFLSRPLHFG